MLSIQREGTAFLMGRTSFELVRKKSLLFVGPRYTFALQMDLYSTKLAIRVTVQDKKEVRVNYPRSRAGASRALKITLPAQPDHLAFFDTQCIDESNHW